MKRTKKLKNNINLYILLIISFSQICIMSNSYLSSTPSSQSYSKDEIKIKDCILLIQKSNSSTDFIDPEFSSNLEFIENEITFEVIYKDENGISPINGVFLRLSAPFSLDKNMKVELKTKDNQSDSDRIKTDGLKFKSGAFKLNDEGQWKYYLQAFGENNSLLKESKQYFGPYIFGYNDIMRIVLVVMIILVFSILGILGYIAKKKKNKEMSGRSLFIFLLLMMILSVFRISELFLLNNTVIYLILTVCCLGLFFLTTYFIIQERRIDKKTGANSSEIHENADE